MQETQTSTTLAMAVLTVSSSQFLATMSAFALAFAIHTRSSLGFAEAMNSGGFSLELIHRDSPKSPLYNASETPSQRVANSLRRSLRRAKSFESKSDNSLEYDFPGVKGYDHSGEFLVKFGIGTPPLETYLIVDTSSSLVWTQCKGCTHCMALNTPAFDPSASSSFDNVACASHSCNFLQNNCADGTCRYKFYYDGGSTYTNGVLVNDHFTATSTTGELVTLYYIRFGCGYDNEMFFSSKVSGVLAMGNGFISFAHQVQYLTGGRFSYCFVPSHDVPGRLNFGDSSFLPGPNVVSTPLILDDSDSLYRFTLTAISVGKTRIELGKYAKVGNMVVDTGIVQTLIPPPAYITLADEVRKLINETELEPPLLDEFEQLCYPSWIALPHTPLTMHLLGADLTLKLSDMFKKDYETSCLTIGSIDNQNLFFYGNWAQSNFLVGIDVDSKTISFKPSDCSGT